MGQSKNNLNPSGRVWMKQYTDHTDPNSRLGEKSQQEQPCVDDFGATPPPLIEECHGQRESDIWHLLKKIRISSLWWLWNFLFWSSIHGTCFPGFLFTVLIELMIVIQCELTAIAGSTAEGPCLCEMGIHLTSWFLLANFWINWTKKHKYRGLKS